MTTILTHYQPPNGARFQIKAPFHALTADSHQLPILGKSLGRANPNSTRGNEVQRLLKAVRALPARHAHLKPALMERLLTNRRLVDIAARYACSVAVLSYWTSKLRLPLRKRGRRALGAPTAQHQQLIRLFRRLGAMEAARRSGLSRARIYQVISKWRPSTKRPRICRKPERQKAPKRRIIKRHVVAFRLTHAQWRLLLASRKTSSEKIKMSGFDKARAIVLAHITPQTDPPSVRSKDASTPVQATSGNKIVDFIERKTG